MSGENTETLYLTQLERESAGLYACGAQNSEGETRSSTIMLKVQCKYTYYVCVCVYMCVCVSHKLPVITNMRVFYIVSAER